MSPQSSKIILSDCLNPWLHMFLKELLGCCPVNPSCSYHTPSTVNIYHNKVFRVECQRSCRIWDSYKAHPTSAASPPVCHVGRRRLRNLGCACNPPFYGQWHYIPQPSHRSGRLPPLLWRGQWDVLQNVPFSKPSLIKLAKI